MLNVSAQRITRPRGAAAGGTATGRAWLANHSRKVRAANFGTSRRSAMPASRLATTFTPGVCVNQFTSPGIFDASRAQRWMKPMLHACSGRRTC